MLVYDLLTNRAYQLNETSTIVFQACGQKQTFGDVKARHEFTDEMIHFALGELKKNNLPVISSLAAPTSAMAQSAFCSSGFGPVDPDGRRGSGQTCFCNSTGNANGVRACIIRHAAAMARFSLMAAEKEVSASQHKLLQLPQALVVDRENLLCFQLEFMIRE